MPAVLRSMILAAALLFALVSCAAPAEKSVAPVTRPSAEEIAPPFKSRLFEDLNQFHRIVIVWDASGSMINKMSTIKSHLKAAFECLSPDQSFNLISLQNETLEAIDKEMLPATAQNKKKAAAHLKNLTTAGTTNPFAGLEEAFREKPDVIYLLDDGNYPDNDVAIRKINELNKDRKTKIYTVAFLDRANPDPEFVTFFKKLASDGSGKFKGIYLDDLDDAYRSPMFADLDQYHRIIILWDGSGSIINKMASLWQLIRRAVISLSPEQSFNLILLDGPHLHEVGTELLASSPANKRKALEYCEGLTTTGVPQPIPAIAEAFRQKPEVIYLVTDGDFPDNDAILRKFRELNKDGKVKVYTISFITASDTDTAYLEVLKTIARESGGKFKQVQEEEVEE